jgi:Tol biopolymer transport system component
LDGRIVYPSQWDRNSALSIVDSNGSNARRLKTFDSSHMAAYPAASPLGGFLVFSEWSAGDHANVWRVEMKDGSISRLTGGNQDFPSSVTADGAWIVYGSISGDKPVLMKVASHGGAPIQLTNYNSDHPAVSPDGAWIACSYSPQSNHPPQLALVPIAGGQPAKTFLLPASASPFPLAWSPDGMSIAYINQVDGVDNIWRQPLAGGAPAPVTRLDSGRIFSFDWSRDGRLALSRGSAMTDAVLIGPTR